MRTCMYISFVLFVILTIALTILFSEPPIPVTPVTGMNLEVMEGRVRVTSASNADTIHAGEIAEVTAGGQIRKSPGQRQAIANADVQSASDPQSIAFVPPEGTIVPTIPLSATPVIEYVTVEYYYIAGYVQSDRGDYLANSQITCQRREENRLESIGNTRSNPNGYYILQLQEPGDYEVKSTPAEEDYFEETKPARLTEIQKNAGVFFVHQRGALSFKGRIIAKKGNEPISGAKVHLIDYQESKDYRAMSAEDGRFRIKNIAEGTFDVSVSAEGYIDYDARERRLKGIAEPLANLHISQDTQLKEFTIKMEEGNAVTVLVVDGNQTPVPSVWVIAHPSGNENQDNTKKTDANGIAEFTNIPSGKVFFHAEKEGYGETISDIVEIGNNDTPAKVTIELKEPASITGRVVYLDGSPAEGWDIYVHNVSTERSDGGGSFISTHAKTDADGKYTIPGLGKGEYTFFIFKYDERGRQRVKTDRIISLQDGEKKQNVDFVIEEGTETIQGIVLSPDGNPVSGAKVTIHPVGDLGPNSIFSEAVCTTNENGEFSIGKLLKKNTVMVSVTAEGYKPMESAFPMGESITVTLAPADFVGGIVLDQTTQQPISGANVILRNPFQRDQIEITDTNGSFKFANFEEGTYQLFAFADGYAYSQIIPINTETNLQANRIVLPLENANEFRGIVADFSGKPVLGAIVCLESRVNNRNKQDEFRGLLYSETFLSNENGFFTISNRSHQPDTLVIEHPQFAMSTYPIPAEWDNDRPPVFYLNQGGTIEGVILNQEQNPIANGEVHFIGNPNLIYSAKTKIDLNGHYRIDRLPTSNYHAYLYADIEKDMGFVHVQENQTTRVDFVVGNE